MGASASIIGDLRDDDDDDDDNSDLSTEGSNPFTWLKFGCITIPSPKHRNEDNPVDSSITNVPTYDKQNPYEKDYQIHSKLGR
jgi:hypothetical protein